MGPQASLQSSVPGRTITPNVLVLVQEACRQLVDSMQMAPNAQSLKLPTLQGALQSTGVTPHGGLTVTTTRRTVCRAEGSTRQHQ